MEARVRAQGIRMSNEQNASNETNANEQTPQPELETGMPKAVWVFFGVVILAIVSSLMLE